MRFPWRRSPRRTLLLGVAALGVLLWGAASQFGIPRETLLSLLGSTLLSLLLVMAAAALSVGFYVALRSRLFPKEHAPHAHAPHAYAPDEHAPRERAGPEESSGSAPSADGRQSGEDVRQSGEKEE